MALAGPTNVAGMTGGSTANTSVFTTGAGVLTAGRKYLVRIASYRASGAQTPNTVVHDAGGTPLSFTLVSGAEINNYDSATHRHLSVWEVTPSADTASAGITITFPSGVSSCGWSVDYYTGQDDTGTFVQVVTNTGQQTADITVTMGAFGASGNGTYLAMAWGDGTANPAETISPTESRSELEEHGDGERNRLGAHYQTPNGSDTSIGATLSASTVDWGAIGIEIKEAAAAGAQMEAAVTAAVTVAGALTTEIRMAAAITGAVTVAGALTTEITMAAAATASATVAGALTTEITMAAAVTASATTAADLTAPQQILLEAAVTASATTAGALTTEITLAGAVTGSASVAAALTTEITLAAAATATATVAGSLTTEITLASSVTATAVVAGDLTLPGQLLLDAAVTATGTVAGSLTTEIRLAAAVTCTAGATAALTTEITLAGAITATATTAGALTTEITLAASITATAGTAGNLTTEIRLAATVTATATMTGALGEPTLVGAGPYTVAVGGSLQVAVVAGLQVVVRGAPLTVEV